MGTTNQQYPSVKKAKKLAEEARKKAEQSGWQSMAYKFSKLKEKK